MSLNNEITNIILPIDPLHILVAYNKYKINILSTNAKYDDVSILNTLQAKQANNAIFSQKKFPKSDLEILKVIFSKKPRSNKGFFDEKSYILEEISFNKDLQSRISFLQINQ